MACLHHRAFYQIYQSDVSKLGHPEKDQSHEEMICDLIRFHISRKEYVIFWEMVFVSIVFRSSAFVCFNFRWFLQSARVFSPYIMIQLISGIFFLAPALVQLDLQFKNMDYNILACSIAAIAGLTNLFVYCYFGDMATTSFAQMSAELYKSNWEQLPVKLQKYLILMIRNTQRPLYYDGFRLVVLDMKTLAKVFLSIRAWNK